MTSCRSCSALLTEKLCTYPLGYIFSYLLYHQWHNPASKFSLPWHFLLFYTIIAVFILQFRLGRHVNLVTPFFLFCVLLSNDPYCVLKQTLKMSNPPGIQGTTADPISCPIKAIANKSNSAGSRQDEKAFMNPGHKMSIKHGTMAPHKYWHKKLSIVIGTQP